VTGSSAAAVRAEALLTPEAAGVAQGAGWAGAGYLDLLGGDEAPGATGLAGRLMLTRAVPFVYERWWRPAWGRVAKGVLGPGMSDEHRIARLLLGLTPGDAVLDVACGPGNFTRDFARVVGPAGVAVGIDASATMLARAVDDTPTRDVAYVRGDAEALPFRDGSFDAVCCFAALNLIAEPFFALDEMARVLAPGGRIALFTSCGRGPAPMRAVDGVLGAPAGMRIFGPDELTEGLTERGFGRVNQRIAGFTQFVGGTKT